MSAHSFPVRYVGTTVGAFQIMVTYKMQLLHVYTEKSIIWSALVCVVCILVRPDKLHKQ